MDSRGPVEQAGTARGVGVLLAGVVLALWIVAGRFLFGIGGELAIAYLLIGVLIVILHVYIGRALTCAAARGFGVRPSTRGTVIAAWGCGVLLGLTIPDLTPDGLQTILTGAAQPWLEVAIGVANPAGILTVAFTIIALVLANQDAHGPRSHEDDLL
ncbi:membrane protease YdiL (CAAX protease family) [Microbacterium sp. W4I4]|uniref:hypothetical protein n=1 Tax=Microbacterium sp. W4I4 TaxID=3042295 RepID=UPI002787AC00|nr:hypothetical protein [Microbacterium sp. W4I4]MDQ0614596.1 membrane protease YdiL (CAAX protease family) [Microbacterium sp. W4I4]